MLEDARRTNRLLYQARLLAEEGAQAQASAAGRTTVEITSQALRQACEAGALALTEKALAAAVAEFGHLQVAAGDAWLTQLREHQHDNAALARLYAALAEGQLVLLMQQIRAPEASAARGVQASPGMIASDTQRPSLQALLNALAALLSELREGTIEW